MTATITTTTATTARYYLGDEQTHAATIPADTLVYHGDGVTATAEHVTTPVLGDYRMILDRDAVTLVEA